MKAHRIQNLKPSFVFEMVKKAEQLRKEGRDIISLAIGEPIWDTYETIKEAGKKAIDTGHTKYTPAKGTTNLCVAIQKYVKKTLDLDFDKEEIMVSSGCKFSLFSIFQCFCNPGDEVILPAPYWLSYPNIISLSEAKVKIIQTSGETGFKITKEQLESQITDKTKVFLLNSPNNPTSAIYSEEELKSLGEVLERHPNIIIVTDDIYDRIAFDREIAPHLLKVCPQLKDRIIAVNGASKVFLMTGWRISWVLGNKKWIKVLSSFQSQSISCPNSISQKALEDSLLHCEEEVTLMVSNLKKLRDIFYKGIKSIPEMKPYLSEGAFYLWVDVKGFFGKSYDGKMIETSTDLMELLLEKESLLCLNGEEFGSPGHLRFTYGVEEKTLKEAISRISSFISRLT